MCIAASRAKIGLTFGVPAVTIGRVTAGEPLECTAQMAVGCLHANDGRPIFALLEAVARLSVDHAASTRQDYPSLPPTNSDKRLVVRRDTQCKSYQS